MPSNKDKKSKKAIRAGARQPQSVPSAQPAVAAEEPKLTHKDIPEKYRFTDEYLNWLQNSHGRTTAREVNETTERIFDSVLSKLGWSRNEEGNLERNGEKVA
ncbi:MAG TPA: hypothetical protein VGR50_07365 [Terriglobales bacterium]|nr:hypothetical protein [Terriglobales bacterium]